MRRFKFQKDSSLNKDSPPFFEVVKEYSSRIDNSVKHL